MLGVDVAQMPPSPLCLGDHLVDESRLAGRRRAEDLDDAALGPRPYPPCARRVSPIEWPDLTYNDKKPQRRLHGLGRVQQEGTLMASETLRKPRREKIGRRLYEVHNLDGSTSYFADLEIEGRQVRRKLAATTRTAAREEQQNLNADSNRNLVAAPTKITLAEVAEEWILGLEVRPRSLEAYRYQLDSNILPTLGAKPVQEIRPRSCNALKTKLREQGLALETRLAALRVLERVLEHAIIEGYIVSNPMERIQKRPQGKPVKEAHRYLSPAEISKLLDHSNGYRAIIEVAAFTGLRQMETLGLVWGDLDLTAGTLTVSAQLSRADKIEDAKRVPTKTGEERTVNIDPGLVTLFRDLKEKAFADGHARPGLHLPHAQRLSGLVPDALGGLQLGRGQGWSERGRTQAPLS